MPQKKLLVFLVDDESIIRSGMKKLLDWEGNGFAVIGEAENGRDALPIILSVSPDIIITDLKMPFCDGITLAAEIKKSLPAAEIVILTGYDEFEYAKQAIKIGVFDFLLKPVSPNELKDTLERIKEKLSRRESLAYPLGSELELTRAIEEKNAEKSTDILKGIFSRLRSATSVAARYLPFAKSFPTSLSGYAENSFRLCRFLRRDLTGKAALTLFLGLSAVMYKAHLRNTKIIIHHSLCRKLSDISKKITRRI